MCAVQQIRGPRFVDGQVRRLHDSTHRGNAEIRVETIACPECDLLQELPPLPTGAKACCARCGETLVRRRADPLDRPLALTIAAAFAFVVANATPLMSLSAAGRQASTTILGGALETWRQGSQLTAVAVAFCAVIAPAAYLLCLLIVLLTARHPPAPRWVGGMLRSAHMMEPWSMTEVMMLGILVALVKIAQLATVVPGIGMFAQGAFIGLLTAVIVSFDPREIWMRVRWADGTVPSPPGDRGPAGAPG
jgi:paraquat-inducible protein A